VELTSPGTPILITLQEKGRFKCRRCESEIYRHSNPLHLHLTAYSEKSKNIPFEVNNMKIFVILFVKYPNFAHFIITEGKEYLNVVVTVTSLELLVFDRKRGAMILIV
jgi:hypothetical protein